MKKLIFALNNFLEAFDESDFYKCELKNNRILLWGNFSNHLADKLEACGLHPYGRGDNHNFCGGVVTVILVVPYRTNGHVK